MSHTNAQVAAAFVRQEPAQSLHMRSDGNTLYSYDTPIACHDSGTIRVSCQQHSITTTRHHGELWNAAYAAGYDGPASWAGRPEEYRRAEKRGENVPDLVPFHQIKRIDIGSGKHYDATIPHVCGYSNRDAPAVVWHKLTETEREEKRQRERDELDVLRAAWKERTATS